MVEINKIGSQSRCDVPTVTCWYKNTSGGSLSRPSANGVVLDRSCNSEGLMVYMGLLIQGAGPTMIMNYRIAGGCRQYEPAGARSASITGSEYGIEPCAMALPQEHV